MAGGLNKMPISVMEAKRTIHRSRAEIEERRASEVRSSYQDLEAPPFLKTKKQKEYFYWLGERIEDLGVLSELDDKAIADYVIVCEQHEKAQKCLTKAINEATHKNTTEAWELVDPVQKAQEKLFKQKMALASKLGLTPVDRARLSAPKKTEEKKNKFEGFLT